MKWKWTWKNKSYEIFKTTIPIIMIDQNQLENVESLKYLGRILTNNGKYTCEIKCRIAIDKAAFTRRGLFLLAHWTWN